MLFVDYIHNIVEENTKGFDAIYGDYIAKLVGLGGLTSLLIHGRLETCGVINGRQLYALRENTVRERERV